MGKTSNAAKDKWNAAAYEDIRLRVRRGMKSEIQSAATARGESLNGFINRAIAETMERENAAQEE
ncbi:MAG: antitoxin [Oscillospiraceae bacterium]|nr:antitoxin [Oscillospiraceae bacterium]